MNRPRVCYTRAHDACIGKQHNSCSLRRQDLLRHFEDVWSSLVMVLLIVLRFSIAVHWSNSTARAIGSSVPVSHAETCGGCSMTFQRHGSKLHEVFLTSKILAHLIRMATIFLMMCCHSSCKRTCLNKFAVYFEGVPRVLALILQCFEVLPST